MSKKGWGRKGKKRKGIEIASENWRRV